MALKDVITNLPEVAGPAEKKLPFNTKLKWTLIILVLFFILANISLFKLSKNALEQFEFLAIILGTDFGSIISLGIGPIVMASIILQLLVGSKILNIDLTTHEGKKYFQGLQKLLVIFFIIFEAVVYVLMGGLQADPGFEWLLILQLFLGGLIIVFMDEVVSKWGFGSGVSLFIAAGVGWRLFAQTLGIKISEGGGIEYVGKVLIFFQSIATSRPTEALLAFAALLVTAIIFALVVWAQAVKVEVPLSFERLRGYTIRWPLAFFYTSVIPIILTAALLANVQLFARLNENAANMCIASGNVCGFGGHLATKFLWLGTFSAQGNPQTGLVYWLSSPNLVSSIFTHSFTPIMLLQALLHTLYFVFFAVLFAIFWVRTSGMDASSQARQILSSGLQIPGFRRDARVLEAVLNRYIMPLTVMGAVAIGLLSSLANLLGAVVSGTAILLAVMIVYKLYEEVAQQHALDMHPAMKKFMG